MRWHYRRCSSCGCVGGLIVSGLGSLGAEQVWRGGQRQLVSGAVQASAEEWGAAAMLRAWCCAVRMYPKVLLLLTAVQQLLRG